MRKLLISIGLILCSAFGTRAQVPVALMPVPRMQFFNATGQPLASGCVNFFAAGTSTPQAIYADSGGVNQLSNPLTLDSAGEASVWLANLSYKVVVNTGVVGQPCSSALGTQLWAQDNVSSYQIINQAQNLFLACATSDPSGSQGELACRSDLGKIRFFSSLWDSVVGETTTATLTNKTFANPAFTGAATGFVGTSPVLNNPQINGTIVTGPPATYLVMTNDLVTGTVLNKLAKINPAGLAGFAILPLISDTGGVTGIVVAGAGITANATIQQSGSASCVFDNAVTSGDYVQISSSVAGDCHDAGVSYPATGQILGRVLATNASPGTYIVDLFGPEIKTQTPGVVVAAVSNLTAQQANIIATTLTTPGANGFYRISCYVVETQAATTSSTLPACAVLYSDADSNFAETLGLTLSSANNVVGQIGSLNTISPTITTFFAKSGVAIQFNTSGYASVGATPMQYAVHVRLEGPF